MITEPARRAAARLRIAVRILLCALTMASAAPARAVEQVTVQLNWKHQFEFAAFYAAQAQGYYREAGLDVAIREGGPGIDVTREVVEGRAEFGVGTSALVVERYRGAPVVALAALMQHSPVALLALRGNGIESVHDLAGRPIAVDPHDRDEIDAYLRAIGIPPDRIKLVDQTEWGLASIHKGLAAAEAVYVSNEPFLIRDRQDRYLLMTPRSAGIDLFGNILFSTEGLVKSRRDMVKAFRDATLRGLAYALDHPAEITDLILAGYNTQNKSRDHLLFEAARIGELTRHDIVEPGYMSPNRWRHVVDVYAHEGKMPAEFDIAGFVYAAAPARMPAWVTWVLFAACAGLLVALIVTAKLRRLNRELRQKIGERLVAEAALQASEQRFRTLTELSADWYWEQDEQYRFTSVSSTIHEKAGRRPAHAIGKTRWELPLVGVSDEAWAAHRAQLERHESFHDFTYQVHNERGELRWFSVSGRPYYSGDGVFRGYRGTGRDITEATRIQEIRARLSAIVENSTDAIISRSLDGTILTWNLGAQQLFGYTAEEAIGQPIEIIVPPHLRGSTAEHSTILKEGACVPPTEIVRQTKDGRLIDVLRSVSPIRNEAGETIGAAIIARDITEIKRTEAALREREELFRELAGNIPEVFWVRDAITQRMLYLSPSVVDIAGRLLPEGVNFSALFDFAHPEDRPRIEALSKVHPLGGIDDEVRIVRPDGTVRWVYFRTFPMRNEAGQVYRVGGIASDITDRKVVEQEVRRLNADLERRVTERTRELEQAMKELESFTYTVAHDLRSPLRGMNAFCNILLEDYGTAVPEEGRRYLERVSTNAQRMGHLIDDLLTFSRTSRQPLHKQRVDMDLLVGEVVADQVPLDAKVEVLIDDLPPCEADPSLMRQALVNLVSNAVKYSLRTSRPVIRIGFEDGAYFVQDNGVGFDMAHADKLFGVFHRLHRQEEFEGTGVGLAIVKRIVDRHGGRAWAQAEPGKGATFFIRMA